MANKHILNFDSRTFLKKTGARKTTGEYVHNQAIFTQGDAADSMFYIERGGVKLTVLSNRGKKAVIGILRQGDFFGEGCLAKKGLRISTATAIHQSTIARVTKPTRAGMSDADPAVAKRFISQLLVRNGRIEEDLVDQIFSSSEKRLARPLLQLASSGDRSTTEPALLKISQ